MRGAQLASTGQERRGDGREKGDLISFRDRRCDGLIQMNCLSDAILKRENNNNSVTFHTLSWHRTRSPRQQ